MDVDRFAELGLLAIDREVRRRRIRCPGTEQDCRSRAHEALARVLGKMDGLRDPTRFLARVVRNAVSWELKAQADRRDRLRADARADVPPVNELTSWAPSPPTVALFREALALADRPLHKPTSQAMHATEWETFRAVVRDNPGVPNRHIALQFNRLTGRNLNLHTVSRARRRMGI